MTPETTIDLTAVATAAQSDKTFALDFENGRIGGKIDGVEAIRQAAYLRLLAERYEHIIYSWNYGFERADLIGKPKDLAVILAETRIKDALLADSRILAVDSFVYTFEGGSVTASFTVHTQSGDFEMQTEVTY